MTFHELMSFLVVLLWTLTSILTRELHDRDKCVGVLRQNVKVVILSITLDYLVPSLSFNVSRSSGNSNSNLTSVTSNCGLGLRQFDGTAAQSLRFLQNMIL